MENNQVVPDMLRLNHIRDDIARFLAESNDLPHQITEICDRNGWSDGIVPDLKDGLFRLGTVLAALVNWPTDVELTKDQRRRLANMEIQ